MHMKKSLILGCILCATALNIANSWASEEKEKNKNHYKLTYKISITNLTPGQPVTPLMAATHRPGMSFFNAGDAPTPELAILAETGNGNPMATRLNNTQGYGDVQVGASGTAPGETTMMTITANSDRNHVSFGAMLGNTNDAFIALRDVKLPKGKRVVTYYADTYDAGSETNDESCGTVVGPACGGEGFSPNDVGEGFMHIHNGIHGIGDLDPAIYDWRNPAAQIVIQRMN
ncbi:Spondin domain-containing protein [Candidatus Nitrotoga sp. M5]|nr:Spondin domain-containing protein [Candidatus Nitrotoga sp. M5]